MSILTYLKIPPLFEKLMTVILFQIKYHYKIFLFFGTIKFYFLWHKQQMKDYFKTGIHIYMFWINKASYNIRIQRQEFKTAPNSF